MITTCEKIILEDFICASCEGNLSVLGEGTDEERNEALRQILTQYARITMDTNFTYMWRMYRDLQCLRVKVAIIKVCTDSMQDYYLPEFGQILSQYGLIYNWECERELYITQLENVVTRAGQWIVDLKLLQNEWDKLNKDSEGSKMTREYFEDALILFSKDAGYHLRTTQITLFQFARMLVAFRKKAKQKKR